MTPPDSEGPRARRPSPERLAETLRLHRSVLDQNRRQAQRAGAGPRGQLLHTGHADAARSLAFVSHRAGAEPGEVRDLLAESARAFRAVQEAGDAPGGPPGDPSLTNPRSALAALHAALAAGERELAGELAERTGDPPDADYIGPRSEVATPDDRDLAHALRELVLERGLPAGLGGLARVSTDAGSQARLLVALAEGDGLAFLAELDRRLGAFRRVAESPGHRDDPERFLDLAGLALAALALDRGVIGPGDLVDAPPYFPVALLGGLRPGGSAPRPPRGGA